MTAAAPTAAEEGEGEGGAPTRSRKTLVILIAVPLLLGGIGAGLWFSGLLKGLIGGKPPEAAVGEATPDGQQQSAQQAVPAPRPPPVFLDMPEIIANLNVGNRRTAFIKLRSKLELARPEDKAVVEAAMPRLQDLFTTYLREIRPEELRGSAGTWRLREELLARANVAVAPAKVVDVLFLEMLQQ